VGGDAVALQRAQAGRVLGPNLLHAHGSAFVGGVLLKEVAGAVEVGIVGVDPKGLQVLHEHLPCKAVANAPSAVPGHLLEGPDRSVRLERPTPAVEDARRHVRT
jgi:hypothetical protein